MLGTGGAEYILNPETLVRAHVTHLTLALSHHPPPSKKLAPSVKSEKYPFARHLDDLDHLSRGQNQGQGHYNMPR
jgi:hypothetical protein